ncbi:MAG: metallophosphoesterase family protein [Elusimicrobia bacterium]|nr:metallophosphoesterase family protein [Elusimicrobiota bacterium]
MLWGVLSDIHSNLEALEAAVDRLASQGAEGWLCCGDIVGYGAEPNPVLDRLRGLKNIQAVRGNHDLAVLGRMDIAWFNEAARAAVEYTQSTITAENLAWLKELPPRVDAPTFTLVHGSPRNPAEEYLVTVQQFHDNCSYFKTSPCFVGHSHLPMAFLMSEPVSYVDHGPLTPGQVIPIPEHTRIVINPGSVGQPRDHEPRASCGLYDDGARTFTLNRVKYDVDAVQKKIRSAGLPEFLALRLAYGQ